MACREWRTSLSPRVVFDRATFPLPAPPGFRRPPEWRTGTRFDKCGSVGMRKLSTPGKIIFAPIPAKLILSSVDPIVVRWQAALSAFHAGQHDAPDERALGHEEDNDYGKDH